MSKPVTCEKCGMKFKGMQGLAQHRRHPVNCKPKRSERVLTTWTEASPADIRTAITELTDAAASAHSKLNGVTANELLDLCDTRMQEWQRVKDAILLARAELMGKQA